METEYIMGTFRQLNDDLLAGISTTFSNNNTI